MKEQTEVVWAKVPIVHDLPLSRQMTVEQFVSRFPAARRDLDQELGHLGLRTGGDPEVHVEMEGGLIMVAELRFRVVGK
jgi:hypothetical protein